MRLPTCLALLFASAITACSAEAQEVGEQISIPSPVRSKKGKVRDAEVSAIERPFDRSAAAGGSEGSQPRYWIAFDEPSIEHSIGSVFQRLDGEWEASVLPFIVPEDMKGKTTDVEAFARRGEWIYLFGSHFGKKVGPLEETRQFVGRFYDGSTWETIASLSMDAVWTPQLFRVINDALRESEIELWPKGEGEQSVYILPALEAWKETPAAPREEDRAINIEGATFLADDTLLLGLRFPCSADGNPLLLEVENIDAVFEGGLPAVRAVRELILPAGLDAPHGIRALDRQGDELHVIVGNMEREHEEGSTLLKDHPVAGEAHSSHLILDLPGWRAKLHRSLKPEGSVEGITFDGGGALYVLDAPDVRLLR